MPLFLTGTWAKGVKCQYSRRANQRSGRVAWAVHRVPESLTAFPRSKSGGPARGRDTPLRQSLCGWILAEAGPGSVLTPFAGPLRLPVGPTRSARLQEGHGE